MNSSVLIVAAALAPEAMPTATARPHPHAHPKHRRSPTPMPRRRTRACLNTASNLNRVGNYAAAARACRDAAKIDRNRRATLTRSQRVADACQSGLHARLERIVGADNPGHLAFTARPLPLPHAGSAVLETSGATSSAPLRREGGLFWARWACLPTVRRQGVAPAQAI